MIKIRDKVVPPMDELLFISPNDRQIVFKNLLDNYKVYFPDLKRIYAYLNFNANIGIDYIVMFTANIEGQQIVLWDAPYLYTSRTTPGYKWAIKNNLYDEFFKDCWMHMCRMPYPKFKEFIKFKCKLNFSKDSKEYWKDPNNGNIILEQFSSMAMQYNPF